ncbi:hypothetical protein POVCU2_0006530 [Plasmodium ovale curtisi]|uniref:Uncharacterized protein n=1 Tax=Plasmodium ovale curtisi TaxID=864141 RepID=A0A1A8VLV8_PLAOA|nr:hypothetical protein POVCU2_0006530 [Plasmodium ovale curtisi]SBS81588.1 hypothetical protein POVCU1_005840 [Plasmodium ovale curtisi]
MEPSFFRIALLYLALLLTVNGATSVGKVHLLWWSHAKGRHGKFYSRVEFPIRKNYFNISILRKINKLGTATKFVDVVYANKKKSIVSMVYGDIIKKNKKLISDRLEEIVKKQQNYSFPLFFNEKLNSIINEYLKNDKYEYKNILDHNIIDSEFDLFQYNFYVMQFYDVFNECFFGRSIKTFSSLINQNVQFFLLKNCFNDKYMTKKILYIYKTFFSLTVRENTITLFMPFQENSKLIQHFESKLDSSLKSQTYADIPNLRIMNRLNFLVMLLKIMLSKMCEMLFYFVLLTLIGALLDPYKIFFQNVDHTFLRPNVQPKRRNNLHNFDTNTYTHKKKGMLRRKGGPFTLKKTNPYTVFA